MSKQAKLLSHLQAGNELTAKQIKGSFGIAHPASAVRALREAGHCVYANRAKLADGTRTVKYRIGTPSKRMIAIVNAVVGASAFTAQRTR
jgi:hypothetical protein